MHGGGAEEGAGLGHSPVRSSGTLPVFSSSYFFCLITQIPKGCRRGELGQEEGSEYRSDGNTGNTACWEGRRGQSHGHLAHQADLASCEQTLFLKLKP